MPSGSGGGLYGRKGINPRTVLLGPEQETVSKATLHRRTEESPYRGRARPSLLRWSQFQDRRGDGGVTGRTDRLDDPDARQMEQRGVSHLHTYPSRPARFADRQLHVTVV